PLLLITFFYQLRIWCRRNDEAEYHLGTSYGRTVLRWLGYRVQVQGQLHPEPRRFAIASNHASYLDFAVLLGYLPTPIRFIAKRELTKLPVIGGHLARRGVLIDRKNRAEALPIIEKAVDQHPNIPILIFPEGTRSADGLLKPFKRGGLAVLIARGLDIVP